MSDAETPEQWIERVAPSWLPDTAPSRDVLEAEWERVDPEGVAALRASAAALAAAAPKPHDPLCFDKVGHPHDNECECWCHDEATSGTAPNSPVVDHD